MNRWLLRQMSALLTIFLVTSGFVTPITMASQETGDTTAFYVAAYECPYDPGYVSVVNGVVPSDCSPVPGLPMHASMSGLGDEYCVTGGDGVCSVSVLADSWLVITADTSPRADLVPLVNPINRHSSDLEAVFVHVVTPVVVPEPVVLPEEPVETVPVVVDEDDVVDPVVVDESDVADPVIVDEGDVADPVIADEDDATAPTDEVDADVTDPADGVDGDATVPADGEEDDVTDPGITDERDATAPADEVDADTTDLAQGEESDATPPADGVDGDITDAADGDESDSQTSEPTFSYVSGARETGLVCYAEADVSSIQLHVFAEGDQLEVLSGPDSGFVYVACGESTGYVDTAMVSKQPPAEIPVDSVNTSVPAGTPEVAPVGTPAATPSANISLHTTTTVPLRPRLSVEMVTGAPAGGLFCHTERDASSSVLQVFRNGDRFYKNGSIVNGWLSVECSGRNGFVVASRTTAVPQPPKAATSVEQMVGDGGIRVACRTTPHPQATIITTLPGRTQFYATGPAANGWLPIQCGGRNGFIPAGSTSAVARTPKAPTSVEQLVGSGNARLACRTAPHPQARVITTLPARTQFYATGPVAGGWLPIQCGGRDGFIPAGNTTAFARPPKAATSVEQLVGSGNARLACRTTPHPQARVITTLPARTQFYATGPVAGGWLPIQCGGRDGFIPAGSTSAVARTPKAPTSVEQLVGAGNARLACRTAPHPQARVITTLPARTQFYATGSVVSGWLPIQCGGRDGFIPVSRTTIMHLAPGSTTSVQMAINSMTCHTTQHPDSSVIKSVSNRELINVTGPAANGWLPVECNGRAGYVRVTNTTSTSRALRPSLGLTTIFNTGKVGTVCRSAPSVNATAIQTVYEGASVRVTGSAIHDWLPVQCAGQNGFIYLINTTTRVPHQFNGTRAAMVQGIGSSGLICRTSVSNGSQIMVLAERSPVEVISWSSGWAKVKCGERDGYVQMRYLTFNASDPWTTGESLWIDVNLSTQYMIVYQGERIIGQTYISSGRYPTFETPTGTFYIVNKIQISAMAGCSGGECWFVPDVPHQMYFTNRGHAFHGTYWHDDYGTRRSHGCINLPLGLAAWLYDLTPYGARVVIHY